MPPYEVTKLVRSAGFDPLAPPLREGSTYVLRATDFRGILMRVVVDAQPVPSAPSIGSCPVRDLTVRSAWRHRRPTACRRPTTCRRLMARGRLTARRTVPK